MFFVNFADFSSVCHFFNFGAIWYLDFGKKHSCIANSLIKGVCEKLAQDGQVAVSTKALLFDGVTESTGLNYQDHMENTPPHCDWGHILKEIYFGVLY